MADWWAHFQHSRGLGSLIVLTALVLTGILWPQPKKPATGAPKPSPRPCSCDAYNGVICRNHAK